MFILFYCINITKAHFVRVRFALCLKSDINLTKFLFCLIVASVPSLFVKVGKEYFVYLLGGQLQRLNKCVVIVGLVSA